MIAGTLLLQWPAGWLSDRGDRRLMIAILAGLGAVAGAGLALLPGSAPPAAVFAFAVLWGAGALSFYGVAVAHAADRAAPGEATGMMSGILMVWAGGAIAGPLLAGLAMESALGPRGLFGVGAAALAALAGAMVLRRRDTPPPPANEKLPFAPALATSVAAAEIDPRAQADARTAEATPDGGAEQDGPREGT
jgi:MFS family permease